MKTCWCQSVLISVMGVVLVLATTASTSAGTKPNILVILADDLGYGELSCQGNPQIPTPNIDSIARNGIRFTSGYVSAPLCSPSRAGLITGRYQQRFGFEFNLLGPSDTNGLPLEEQTIADRLKAAGYATGLFGKWHLGYTPKLVPTSRGFDWYFGFLSACRWFQFKEGELGKSLLPDSKRGTLNYTTDAFGAEAAAFIEQHRARPWFVYLPFSAVHAPGFKLTPESATQKYKDRFPNITDWKRQTYAGMESAMDDAVGVVLAKLRELNLEENTLIFFLSDNGGPTWQTTSRNDPLRGQKGQLLEGGIREPFMVQWKGHLPAGKVDDRPIISLDILPTAMAAAGLPQAASDKIDGVNLLPYLNGENQEMPHEALFWRFGHQRAVRMGDWKLIDEGDGAKLYNLANDIGEMNDRSAVEATKLKELEAAYARWNAANIAPRWAPPARKKAGAASSSNYRQAFRLGNDL